jgi:putative ABC transport system permease protein
MSSGITKLVIKSVRFYRKPVLYQFLIVALLAAVITGSMLTGWSVRSSLKKTATEHLGNTGILISSGIRFFSADLASRLGSGGGPSISGLLELNGFCQNLKTQKGSYRTHLYAVNNNFFGFQDHDSIVIKPGEAAINEKIAKALDLGEGDELILKYNLESDIPADAPFAPATGSGISKVLKVVKILGNDAGGNFSLSITQAVPGNVFVNLSDISGSTGSPEKINRMLFSRKAGLTSEEAEKLLRNTIKPSDIGLSVIKIPKTGGLELRSDRIFIDNSLVEEVKTLIPESYPLITYLGNSFSFRNRHTPYSFVSALPSELYHGIPDDDGIVIDSWMADDLGIDKGDTLRMSWFVPDSLNKLTESSRKFIVSNIVGMRGIWADSLLMPAFPGISGSESCSDWDAGVPINLSEIRPKDEAYWNRYRGTPKAFINYRTGLHLWGNNFGPATAIRFQEGISELQIIHSLSGNLDPRRNGFEITDIFDDSVRAANESVDFSSLFLSLGFFLILAAIVLLSFAVSSHLESRQEQLHTFFALGFKSKWTSRLMFAESGLIATAGSLAGSFAGYAVSTIIIRLLNSVWSGAVQTNTLESFFSLETVLAGFAGTLAIALIYLYFKIRIYLRHLNREKKLQHQFPSRIRNLVFLATSMTLSIALFISSLIVKDQQMTLGFVSGALLFACLILLVRQYLIHPSERHSVPNTVKFGLSRIYYTYYPSHAVTPILFIAAGIFAVFITGANRKNLDVRQLSPSGGTGGFILWCDNSIPVREDLSTAAGKAALGLDDNVLSDMTVVQIRRSAGDDASCLNLNHVASPAILGVDPEEFISGGSFSFAGSVKSSGNKNPWQFLALQNSGNTIYGVADQTVLEWGLKIKIGDTLTMRSETGQKLNVIIAGGLKSSIFQGYVLIGMENFKTYFPSASGSSILLVGGNKDKAATYREIITDRLAGHGVAIEDTADRLESFNEVTNTYLSVFGAFGALGMITGIAGLGFVLLRNYNFRKKEFGLMMATGFNVGKIRHIIFREQVMILLAGIISGVAAAAVSTYSSLSSSPEIPWIYLVSMIIIIFITGTAALLASMRAITGNSLVSTLKRD